MKPPSTTQIIAAILICSILSGLSLQNHLNWIITPVNFFLTPLRTPFYHLNSSLNQNLDHLHNIPHQQRLITDLQRQNNQLAQKNHDLQQIEQENDRLRSLLSVPITPDHLITPVKIIGLSRFATINQGSNSNIQPGMPAVVDNTLIGIIASVSRSTSQIRLLTDPDTNLNIKTLSSATGTLNFQNNLLVITNVPQNQTLNQDEPVFTQGNPQIPPGLLVGYITQINQNPSNPYQTATIKPALNITDFSTVIVILE